MVISLLTEEELSNLKHRASVEDQEECATCVYGITIPIVPKPPVGKLLKNEVFSWWQENRRKMPCDRTPVPNGDLFEECGECKGSGTVLRSDPSFLQRVVATIEHYKKEAAREKNGRFLYWE